jgi:hypothetical protein
MNKEMGKRLAHILTTPLNYVVANRKPARSATPPQLAPARPVLTSGALSGRASSCKFPGLKPWAMMYSRFAATAMHAKAIALFDVYLAPNNFLTAALCAA